KILVEQGYTVDLITIHTIKPLDVQAVIQSVSKTKCVVTAEEHQILGGLGSAIAKVVSENTPAPIEYVGVHDKFGESGTAEQLLTKYGMSTQHVVDAALKVMARK
ncbi:MAG: transketolase C-terminal domain-containing protein, partial [Chitinophagales bacterium]